MRIIRKHIIRSLTLLLLVTAGVALAQMHDTLHLVEDIVVSADHHDSLPNQENDHHECLNCIIASVSANLPQALTVPDYSSEKFKSESTLTVASVSSPAWFLLRAPPAG